MKNIELLSDKTFTISGKIIATFPNNQKTPTFQLSSLNKTLSGTPILLDKSINIYSIPLGVDVRITGTTQDGNSPKFSNPIYVSKVEDITLM